MKPAYTSRMLNERWASLAPRERTLLGAGALVVLLALIWWVALAPALRTLREAPLQQGRGEAQLQSMRALAAQSRALQALPKLGRDDALRALEATVRQRLGTAAELNVNGDRVTLTLKSASPPALAEWLALARQNAHVLPQEARLVHGPQGWDGVLVLTLPAAIS